VWEAVVTRLERVEYDRMARHVQTLEAELWELRQCVADMRAAAQELAHCQAQGQPPAPRAIAALVTAYRRHREAQSA
jgi:hypothetical protein